MLKRGAYYEIQLEQGGWKTDGMKKHSSWFVIKLIHTHQITKNNSKLYILSSAVRSGLGKSPHIMPDISFITFTLFLFALWISINFLAFDFPFGWRLILISVCLTVASVWGALQKQGSRTSSALTSQILEPFLSKDGLLTIFYIRQRFYFDETFC